MGTRQIVGPVLIWLLVAAIIGALTEVPPWSAELSQTMAVEPWIAVGQIVSPIIMIILLVTYLGMVIRAWVIQENLPFIRLIFGGLTTLVIMIISFVLQNTYGKPRPCHLEEFGSTCPADTSFAYPSSFTVIAFALAVGLAYAVPWTAYLVFPLAILESVASVLAGEQFPHDVVAGAALGGLGAIGLLYMFIKVQTKMAEQLTARRAQPSTTD
ncbi:phosphatase PAP2 family protein [Enteractinococcus helveticum]|nr:phosphatase PAP2 family protein [Enteractinococcus helveticum]